MTIIWYEKSYHIEKSHHITLKFTILLQLLVLLRIIIWILLHALQGHVWFVLAHLWTLPFCTSHTHPPACPCTPACYPSLEFVCILLFPPAIPFHKILPWPSPFFLIGYYSNDSSIQRPSLALLPKIFPSSRLFLYNKILSSPSASFFWNE